MMSQRSKREMIEAIRPRYLKADKAEKEQILDEFVATTGYHRKYAIRLLKHGPKPRGLKKAGRKKVYQREVFEYVLNKKEIMPRTSLRYAIEKMPKELKEIAMKR